METAFQPLPSDVADWLSELRRREARGEVRVDWSRVHEPTCIHSTDIRTATQPASACVVCKDGKALAEWKAYWQSLGAPQ